MEEWLKEIQQVIDNESELCRARRKRGISKRQFSHEVVEMLNNVKSPYFKGGFKFKVKEKK